jgi:beta-mannosidase
MSSTELDLGGAWRYTTADTPDFAAAVHDTGDWAVMDLPRNWFLGGLDHHGVVWFRRDFTAALPPGTYATLRFEGVDYWADVYLNGHHLGKHEGYFEAFEFDVTGTVRDGVNSLAVRVDSPFEPVALDGWHMRKRLIKGVLNHHDCRPGGGWVASGQAHNTGGIWNRVTLRTHGAITVDRLLLRADLAAGPPRLVGEALITNRGPAAEMDWTLAVQPDNFEGAGYEASPALRVPPGASRHPLSLPVPGVRRWEPWDRGAPHLYRVRVGSPAEPLATTTFGFRTVSLSADYAWTVNGEPYFPRGTNYIATQWLAEALFPDVAADSAHPFPPPPGISAGDGSWFEHAEPWFERDVRLLREANLNLVRVHAHVLPGRFHDACDRAGILVWQDFPFQWGYRDDLAFQDEAERQALAMVEGLYNHPSIALWCVHNESPWDAEWMAGEAGGSYDSDHNRALDARLAAALAALDPTRHVQRNSGTGDSHVYPGWYYGHWRDYAGGAHGAPFPTEYGAQGLPAAETTRHLFARFGDDAGHAALGRFKAWIETQPAWVFAKDMPPLEAVPAELHDDYEVWRTWRFHDFQPPETFYTAGIPLGDSLDEFIAHSQAYQDQVIRLATESYRQQKGDGITGVIQFMFVEPWPAITWAVLDYWRRPKPSFAVLQQVMQPVLLSAVLPGRVVANEPWTLHLLVINDLRRAYPDAVAAWAIRGEAGAGPDGRLRFDVPPDGKTAPQDVAVPPLAAGDYQLTLSLREGSDDLSHNLIPFKVYG